MKANIQIRPLLMVVAILLFSCTNTRDGEPSTPGKPNVILFLVDDVGYGDVSLHGNPHLQTPNLDRFAKEGVEFSSFYVSPACSPTRASLLTGRYNFRTKNTDVGAMSSYMSPDEITIAELLKSEGYRTAMFGKWHLGETYPLCPSNQGFDEVVWHHFCNITDDYPVGTSYFSPHLFHNGQLQPYEGYCMDIYAREAIRFMEHSVNEGQPFFIYLPATLAHVPLQVPEEYYLPFVEMGISEETSRAYGMIKSIDENFGRLLGTLDQLRVRENTLVIFLSDNGHSSQDLDRYHAGLRGLKGFMYEGGVKVPCFMQLPAVLERGTIVETHAAHIDILPTILDLCQIPVPGSYTIDGKSLKPLATGNSDPWPDRNIYIQWSMGNNSEPYRHLMVRTNRYKLVQEDVQGHSKARLEVHYEWCREHGYTDYVLSDSLDFELYDIRNDPFETVNLADRHPGVVEKLKREYLAWYNDVYSTRGFNRPVLKLNSDKENPVVLTSNFWLKPRQWDMVVETPGLFDVTVYWGNLPVDRPEKLYLKIGDRQYQHDIGQPVGSHLFRNIEIPPGYHGIKSWIDDEQMKLSITTVLNKTG